MKKLEMIKTYYECNMAKDLLSTGLWAGKVKMQRLRFDVLLDK